MAEAHSGMTTSDLSLPCGFAESTPGQWLRELADREEIRDLVALYAHRVTHGLSNADLFTDDGAYIHRRSRDAVPEISRGRAALDAHFVARPGFAGTATPMIHNMLLRLHGNEAEHLCSIELRLAAGAICLSVLVTIRR